MIKVFTAVILAAGIQSGHHADAIKKIEHAKIGVYDITLKGKDWMCVSDPTAPRVFTESEIVTTHSLILPTTTRPTDDTLEFRVQWVKPRTKNSERDLFDVDHGFKIFCQQLALKALSQKKVVSL